MNAALVRAIDAQRTRLFEVSVILACLGNVLDDVYVPGHAHDAPDLECVANVLIRMLDSVAAKLDPVNLRLSDMAVDASMAAAVADGLREAGAQCGREQQALRARLQQAADIIDKLSGRGAMEDRP